jgi:putative ABC transport system permease protein
MGIRVALGAESGQVRNMAVFEGMRLALIGVAIGVASALGLTRLIASSLFSVKASDPLVSILLPIALTGVALVAVCCRRGGRQRLIRSLRYVTSSIRLSSWSGEQNVGNSHVLKGRKSAVMLRSSDE